MCQNHVHQIHVHVEQDQTNNAIADRCASIKTLPWLYINGPSKRLDLTEPEGQIYKSTIHPVVDVCSTIPKYTPQLLQGHDLEPPA